jgi:hypothetical protein
LERKCEFEVTAKTQNGRPAAGLLARLVISSPSTEGGVRFFTVSKGVTDRLGRVTLKNTKRGGLEYKSFSGKVYVALERSTATYYDPRLISLNE